MSTLPTIKLTRTAAGWSYRGLPIVKKVWFLPGAPITYRLVDNNRVVAEENTLKELRQTLTAYEAAEAQQHNTMTLPLPNPYAWWVRRPRPDTPHVHVLLYDAQTAAPLALAEVISTRGAASATINASRSNCPAICSLMPLISTT